MQGTSWPTCWYGTGCWRRAAGGVQIPRGRPSLHQTIKTSKGLQSLDEDGMRHDGMPTPHLRLRHVAQQLPEALIPFVEQKDPLEAHFDINSALSGRPAPRFDSHFTFACCFVKWWQMLCRREQELIKFLCDANGQTPFFGGTQAHSFDLCVRGLKKIGPVMGAVPVVLSQAGHGPETCK